MNPPETSGHLTSPLRRVEEVTGKGDGRTPPAYDPQTSFRRGGAV